MATLTPVAPPTKYATTGITLTMVSLTETHKWAASGKDLVIFHNTEGSPNEITIKGSAFNVETNRSADFTAAIGTDKIAVYGPLTKSGWIDASGNISVTSDSTFVEVGVVSL